MYWLPKWKMPDIFPPVPTHIKWFWNSDLKGSNHSGLICISNVHSIHLEVLWKYCYQISKLSTCMVILIPLVQKCPPCRNCDAYWWFEENLPCLAVGIKDRFSFKDFVILFLKFILYLTIIMVLLYFVYYVNSTIHFQWNRILRRINLLSIQSLRML